ncbi:uncharacterized protein ACOB6Z_000798 [Ctenodactylus gundi]
MTLMLIQRSTRLPLVPQDQKAEAAGTGAAAKIGRGYTFGPIRQGCHAGLPGSQSMEPQGREFLGGTVAAHELHSAAQNQEKVWKKTGQRFSKVKQKRNRRRNKKPNSLSEIMDENSFETWSYLTSGDQNPSPNEEEDFEEMKEKSGYPLTSNLQIEVGDHISGYKGKYWKSIDLEDKFPNVLSTAEFNSSPKEYFLTEDDDLNLTLSSMPNESFVTCLTGTQNLPHVKRDDCSGMKVEKHMVNRQNLSLGTQDLFTETSCLFIKREVIDKRYPNELMSGYQCRSRTADKVLNEEQGVHQSQNNNWAFFTTNVSDHELQSGSDRQPYFGSWPEGPHKFVCEQRPKKDRSCKQTCPASEEQSIKLISTLDGASGPGAILEIPIGEKLLVGNEDLSPPTETSDSSVETEKNIVRSCLPQLDIPNSALESTKNEKEKQKRIFNSAPNFNLLGQSHINIKEMEKCALIRENHEVSIILGEENDKTSEKNDKEENKQNNMTFNYHPPWFCLDIFKNSPLYIGGQLYSHNLSFNRPGQAVATTPWSRSPESLLRSADECAPFPGTQSLSLSAGSRRRCDHWWPCATAPGGRPLFLGPRRGQPGTVVNPVGATVLFPRKKTMKVL